MTKLCPFRKANPFDPTDGSWYWVTTDTYGGSYGQATPTAASINNVIAEAATDGKHVYFPAGTYTITSALTLASGVNMRGASASTTTISGTLGIDSTRGYLLDIPNGASNITLSYLGLDGNDGTHYGVRLESGRSASYITMDHCYVTGVACGFVAIGGTTTSHMTFSNSEFVTIRDFCLFAGESGTHSNWLIEDCTFHDIGPGGAPEHALYLTGIAGVIVTDCTCYDLETTPTDYGWGAYEFDYCTGIEMTNCVAYNIETGTYGGYGFILLGSGTTATLTNCTANVNVNEGLVIFLNPPAQNITITNFTGSVVWDS